MFDCLSDLLCEIKWNLKLFESCMRANEMTFPNFHPAFMISMNSNSFHHKTLKWRWYDFFHLIKWKRVLKRFEFHLEIFQTQKLYATQWVSWEKIKWLLRIWRKRVGSFNESKLKSLWNYFQFGVICFLFKLFFSKNKIYGK